MIYLLLLLLSANVLSHPVLPTRWTSITNEPGKGVGIESYKFVEHPTPENPSGIWSNYTDCARLILVNSNADATRYLLGCKVVDCCTEAQDGNHVEFQIPNVHTKFTKVKQGRQKITVFDKQIDTDTWFWSFGPQNWTAYTSFDNDHCVLHRWESGFKNILDVAIDFQNYTYITETEEFDSLFQVPDICIGAYPCDQVLNK